LAWTSEVELNPTQSSFTGILTVLPISDVLLTEHLSIILVINQLNAQILVL